MAPNRPVSNWLLVCCAVVFAIIVLGGTVRLTRSGLSITEWNPVTGIVPPMSDAAWDVAFAKYRDTPEGRLHPEMTMGRFEFIYWMEFAHRVVARLIGVVFLVPFLWFLLRRRLSRRLGWTLAAIFALGGLQGFVGWIMVKSGLVDEPRVSPYRLALHLLLAIALYSWMLVLAWRLRGGESSPGSSVPTGGLRRAATGLVALVLVMITSGAFVAGTRAGYYFNTFPDMGGSIVPEGFWRAELGALNLFENVATVQFIHRNLAYAIVLLVAGFWWAARRVDGPARWGTHFVLAAVLLQLTLGIVTLVHGVPIALASAHQAGAVVLLTTLWWARERLPAS